jgi:putative ABC transport system ATP-binding protein
MPTGKVVNILLQLNQIHKVFNEGTPDEKTALHRIDLHLKPGDFMTVIGSNGAGKSTLMNMISGKLIPDIGEVLVDGTDVTLVKEHKRSRLIGRVFQDPMAGTAPSMTIEENLAIAYWKTGFQQKLDCCQAGRGRHYPC